MTATADGAAAFQPRQLRGARERWNWEFRADQLVEEGFSCSEDAALDRANGAPTNRSGFLVGRSGNADEEEGFPLAGRQPFKGVRNALKLEVVKLRRWAGELGRMVSIAVGHFAPAGTQFPIVGVAQDCEEPSSQVRAFFELAAMCPRLSKCFLHEIICPIGVTGQGSGKRSKPGQFGH